MKDYITVSHLRSSNFDFSDSEAVLRINTIESLPRELDKPPRLITLKSKDTLPKQCIYATFTSTYADAYETSQNTDSWSLQLLEEPVARSVSHIVYSVLKTLIFMSTHKDRALAYSAATIFSEIVRYPSDSLDSEVLYEVIESLKVETYYGKELVRAIRDTAFRDSEVLLHWRRVSDASGWYILGIKAGEEFIKKNSDLTVKSLDKLLSTAYKEASKDKGWMSRLVKNIPPKPLIGMLWMLCSDNPEVLEPTSDSSFMDTTQRLSSVRTKDFDRVARMYAYEMLSKLKDVSVTPGLESRLRSAVAELHAAKMRIGVDDALRAFSGGKGCIIATTDASVGSLHIREEGADYVCTWN